MEVKEIGRWVERNTDTIACECGGYAEQVQTTKEEYNKYGCGRGSGCCDRAFVCRICGIRWVGSAEAPEMG